VAYRGEISRASRVSLNELHRHHRFYGGASKIFSTASVGLLITESGEGRSGICHLKSMCSEAVEQDFLAKDLSRKLKRPKTRKPDETILAWPQYQSVIDAAQTLRDKLAIKVGSGTAVRPGELFGFRWRSLELLQNGRHALRVKETVYKGKLRPWAKTEESEAYVPLPKRLAEELLEWRSLTSWAGDQDFIFSNSRGGFMDYENFEARTLDPIRLKLGLPKLNFQIL
jgi:integrase